MSRKGENIYKRKDGRWEGRYKIGVAENGRTRYRSCYGKTYREVKARLDLCKQSQITRENRKNSSEKLFNDYCGEWLLFSKTRVKESTIAKYTAAVENHIKPFFGGYRPEQITTELTVDFANHIIQHKKLSVNTAKELMVILKTILKYTVKNKGGMELIDVASPKVVPKEIRVLSQEEQQKLIDFLQEDMNSYKFAILFALMTGLRIGEVCALRFKDISLSNKLVTVRETLQRVKNLDGIGAKTKLIFTAPKSNTSARFVPLTNAAFEMCKDMIDESKPNAFLLTGSETKFTEPRVLQYYIKKYSAACGIENMHFHVLRHTFATRCVEVGFEIKSLSEVLGHSTPGITLERYVHSSLEFKRHNMAKLETIGL